ncbi:MAG TPA: PQQ-dependent sugar dehydrogenase [Gemmatimonadales bacterium]|nr:PQQ-dependent sugar dehydrogenase [Gemmatimonadales bacterium]
MNRWVAMALVAAGLIGATGCADYTKWADPPPLPPPPDTTPMFALHVVAQKLRAPLYVTAPPGDTTRTFIVQQFGHIRVLLNDRLLGPDFLTLTGIIDSSGGERGVLSMAFDPHYATNGRFYVDYTDTLGNIQVVRYNVSAGNPNLADKTTATRVLSIDHHLHANHNGGLLLFGPDGYLYIGVGDGGGAGNPLHSGQDSTVLLAKILRIDVNNLPYTIPPTNPFATRLPAAPEVWDYGLRNPWRFSFDRLTHDFYIGDVGQDSVEEVDREESGRRRGAQLRLAGDGGGSLLSSGGDVLLRGTHAADPDVPARIRQCHRLLHHRRVRLPRQAGAEALWAVRLCGPVHGGHRHVHVERGDQGPPGHPGVHRAECAHHVVRRRRPRRDVLDHVKRNRLPLRGRTLVVG